MGSQKATDKEDIKGYALCRNSPRLIHLLFANDSLLFCKATIQECQQVLNILETYGKCSGQQINKTKTTIFFSKSTSKEVKTHIKSALDVPVILLTVFRPPKQLIKPRELAKLLLSPIKQV